MQYRTNFDCDNLESFLTGLGGGGKFRGKMEKGLENPYSCLVLAGARSMDQRRDALQVSHMRHSCLPGSVSPVHLKLRWCPVVGASAALRLLLASFVICWHLISVGTISW